MPIKKRIRIEGEVRGNKYWIREVYVDSGRVKASYEFEAEDAQAARNQMEGALDYFKSKNSEKTLSSLNDSMGGTLVPPPPEAKLRKETKKKSLVSKYKRFDEGRFKKGQEVFVLGFDSDSLGAPKLPGANMVGKIVSYEGGGLYVVRMGRITSFDMYVHESELQPYTGQYNKAVKSELGKNVKSWWGTSVPKSLKVKPGFTGRIRDKLGRSRCYSKGKPVHCRTLAKDTTPTTTPNQEEPKKRGFGSKVRNALVKVGEIARRGVGLAMGDLSTARGEEDIIHEDGPILNVGHGLVNPPRKSFYSINRLVWSRNGTGWDAWTENSWFKAGVREIVGKGFKLIINITYPYDLTSRNSPSTDVFLYSTLVEAKREAEKKFQSYMLWMTKMERDYTSSTNINKVQDHHKPTWMGIIRDEKSIFRESREDFLNRMTKTFGESFVKSFSGTKKDKRGYTRCYSQGKLIPCKRQGDVKPRENLAEEQKVQIKKKWNKRAKIAIGVAVPVAYLAYLNHSYRKYKSASDNFQKEEKSKREELVKLIKDDPLVQEGVERSQYRSEKRKEMRTGELDKKTTPIRDGMGEGKRVITINGNKAIFKPAEGDPVLFGSVGIPPGSLFRREIAVSSIADVLGYSDIVPVTEYREVEGKPGSVQEFVPGNDAFMFLQSESYGDSTENLSKAGILDFITCQTDRHDGNWRITPEGKISLTDNGGSFPEKPVPVASYLLSRLGHSRAPIPSFPDAKNQWDKMEKILKECGISDVAVGLAKTRFNLITSGKYQSFDKLPTLVEVGDDLKIDAPTDVDRINPNPHLNAPTKAE